MNLAQQTATTIPAPVIKRCGCGAEHSAIDWLDLPLGWREDDGDGGELEYRHCMALTRNGEPCLSSIAIRVTS